jgi:hypothetical protein
MAHSPKQIQKDRNQCFLFVFFFLDNLFRWLLFRIKTNDDNVVLHGL